MANPVILARESVHDVEPLIRTCIGSTVLGLLGSAGGSTEAGERYALQFLLKDLERTGLEAVGMKSGRDVTGVLFWKINSWDTDLLGKVCASLLFVGGEACDELLAFWKKRASSLGVQYVTTRIAESVHGHSEDRAFNECREADGGEEVKLVDLFVETGFTRLERLLFLKRASSAPDPRHDVRITETQEIGPVVRIAGSSYSYDRFHSDPFFSKENADAVHRKWARDSFSRIHGTVLSVLNENNRVAGYTTCLSPPSIGEGYGWIDMLAVSTGERRKGYGESLVLGALRHFAEEGLGLGALSTQEHNAPALALYRKLAFGVYGAASTYRLVL